MIGTSSYPSNGKIHLWSKHGFLKKLSNMNLRILQNQILKLRVVTQYHDGRVKLCFDRPFISNEYSNESSTSTSSTIDEVRVSRLPIAIFSFYK